MLLKLIFKIVTVVNLDRNSKNTSKDSLKLIIGLARICLNKSEEIRIRKLEFVATTQLQLFGYILEISDLLNKRSSDD